jgi:MYXO-CTERM domain-containing protein
MPANFFYVEYRQPIGNFSAPRGNLHQGVLIHAGIDYQPEDENGDRPYLLDMTPGSQGDNRRDFEDAALTVGQTFTDPSGSPRITLVSANSMKATVQIEITGGSGNPTCLDGTEFAPPGPTTCTDPPLPPTGGTGGMPGAGGAASGGAAGSDGTGGVAGSVGSGGVPPGTGGASAGSPGVGGSVAASGGAPSLAGGAANVSGGAGPTGPNGAAAGPAAALDSDVPTQVVGTCACRTTAGATGVGWHASGLAALGLLAFARRRRKP